MRLSVFFCKKIWVITNFFTENVFFERNVLTKQAEPSCSACLRMALHGQTCPCEMGDIQTGCIVYIAVQAENADIARALTPDGDGIADDQILSVSLLAVTQEETTASCGILADVIGGVFVIAVISFAVDDFGNDGDGHGDELLGVGIGGAIKGFGGHRFAGGDVFFTAELGVDGAVKQIGKLTDGVLKSVAGQNRIDKAHGDDGDLGRFFMRAGEEQNDANQRKHKEHQNDEPPAVIPFYKSDAPGVLCATASGMSHGLAITGSEFLGAFLTAQRTVQIGKKTAAIGAFIQIGAIEFLVIHKRAEWSSHNGYLLVENGGRSI